MHDVVSFSTLIHRSELMPRLNCQACGKLMPITLIEPAAKGFEIWSFTCFKCKTAEEFVVEI